MFWVVLTIPCLTESFLWPRRRLSIGGIPIGSSIASPFWFNLSTRNRLLYFGFLPDTRILRTGNRASVYCNTFFRGAKLRRCQSFHHFGQRFPQCSNGIKTLWFSYLMCVSHSIQAFMRFRSIFGLLRIETGVFLIYKHSFSKSFDPKSGLSFFFGRFFKKFPEVWEKLFFRDPPTIFGRLNMSAESVLY